MAEQGAGSGRTRQEIEIRLLENVHRTHADFLVAVDGDRDTARKQFINALQVFSDAVIYGKIAAPGRSEAVNNAVQAGRVYRTPQSNGARRPRSLRVQTGMREEVRRLVNGHARAKSKVTVDCPKRALIPITAPEKS